MIRPRRTSAALATVRGAAIVAAALGGVLIVVGLGPAPRGTPPQATGLAGGEVRIPVREAAWVGAEAPGEPDGRLRAGDASGGAVTYLKFEVPRTVPAAPDVRLQLTAAGPPLPDLIELVAVPDTTWDPERLSWETAPVLGQVVQSVRPAGEDRRVTFGVARVVPGPGTYAFAVTVPPDRGHATFVGADGSAGEPVLRVPPPAPTSAPPGEGRPVTPVPPSPSAPTATPSSPPSSPPPSVSPSPSPSSSPSSPLPPSPSSSTSPSPGPSGPPPDPPSSPPPCVPGERLVPSCGALWGVAPAGHSGAPRHASLAGFEADTGRRQAVYHAYHRGQALFPTEEEVAIAAEGRVLFLNWKPQRWSWAQIARGRPVVDSYLDRLAAHIRAAYPEPFFFTIHHEPENDVRPWPGSGWEAADYAAMYRYVVQRLRDRGVDNLVTVMAFMAYVPWNVQPWFPDLYPGDDVVDWIAWDAYAYSDPGYGHGDFAEMLNRRSSRHPEWPGFYSWATGRFPDKPFMLAEWGVWHSPRNPGHMARFYDSAARQAPLFPRVKALVYFDTAADQRSRDSRPTATEAGLAAYRRLGAHPHFQARVDCPARKPAGDCGTGSGDRNGDGYGYGR